MFEVVIFGALVLAIFSLQVRDLNTSLLIFLAFGVFFSLAFNFFNAPYLSVLQFMVYSGIALIMLFEIEVEEDKSNLKAIKDKKSHLLILTILFFILIAFFSLGEVNSIELPPKTLKTLFEDYLWNKKKATTLATALVLFSSSITILFLHEER